MQCNAYYFLCYFLFSVPHSIDYCDYYINKYKLKQKSGHDLRRTDNLSRRTCQRRGRNRGPSHRHLWTRLSAYSPAVCLCLWSHLGRSNRPETDAFDEIHFQQNFILISHLLYFILSFPFSTASTWSFVNWEIRLHQVAKGFADLTTPKKT